ncbi:MAG: hypothetical protein IKT40_03235 [Bacilli bacterium]|nr:hypothetical protein [Bacilli bacterium]
MKLKELLKNVEDVELTEEQEKQIKDFLEIKNSKKWRPEENEEYYFVTQGGSIQQVDCNESNGDEFRILTNNCFKTKEEAKFRLEQIKVYNELKNFADENNDGICWTSFGEQIKYYMLYDYVDDKIKISTWTYMRDIGQIYFSSKELAIQAIEKVGEDRIKKYLFWVK